MDEPDPGLRRIATWLAAKDAALAEASADVIPLLSDLAVELLVGGQPDADALTHELLGRIQPDSEVRWLLVESLPAWWRKARMSDGKVGARVFVERCADQVAALLVFKNLKQYVAAGAGSLEGILLRRAADRVICRTVKHADEHTEDEISECVLAIRGAAGKFTFRSLGAAVRYFQNAARRRLFPRKPTSVQATRELHEQRTLAETDDEEIEGEGELREQPYVEPATDAEEPAPKVGEERQRAWAKLTANLKPKHALCFWVLLVLYENGKGREWEEIAHLLARPGWCNGDPWCCPPPFTPAQVEAAFCNWARRSGVLSADNLRQTYCRCRKKLGW
jgi:hypothetical protein